MRSYETGIGASGLPCAIDEQFSGGGGPAKRSLLQAVEFSSQTADRDALPDPATYAECMEKAFQELLPGAE
jgi:hypothetical protein